MDLYRLNDIDGFYAAGLHEYLTDEYVALIEWPLPGLDAPARVEAGIAPEGNARRAALRLCGMDDRAADIRAALSPWEAGR